MLRKITVLLAALLMMMVSMPVAMAAGKSNPKCEQTFPLSTCQGHQAEDSLDHDQGGGNDHIKQNRGGGND
jgi:hypothetical protein